MDSRVNVCYDDDDDDACSDCHGAWRLQGMRYVLFFLSCFQCACLPTFGAVCLSVISCKYPVVKITGVLGVAYGKVASV